MADRKISDLTALTTPAAGDYLPIVDISEAAAASKNKRITVEELMRGAPDGTAGAPGFAFESDPNSGIYSPGADQVAISTGGTGRLFVDSSGRVGVGTSSPGRNLHVAGSSATALIESTGSTNADLLIGDGGVRYYGIRGVAGGGSLQIRNDTANTTLATFTSTGLVGIGTTSPSAKLHVFGTGSSSNTLPANASAVFETDGNAVVAVSVPSASAGGVVFPRGTDAYYAGIERAGTDLNLRNNGSTRATIDSSGRLLVGTSTNAPSDTLFVVHGQPGNANEPAVAQLRRGGTILADYTLGQVSFADGSGNIAAHIRGAAEAGWGGTGDAPGRLVFSTTADGASSPTERVRINNAGYTTIVAETGVQVNSTVAAAGKTHRIFEGKHSGTSGVQSSGTTCFIIYTDGDVQNTNNSYGAISDLKLKENIVDAGSQWSDIKALQVRKYNFKEGQTHTQIGLVAQEVELVSPGLVSESPDRDAEGNDLGTVTKSVNYSVLYMKAVKALQEAMERIETLEAKVAALETA